jgi:aspartyl/asparaginyl-tRNA synthetase
MHRRLLSSVVVRSRRHLLRRRAAARSLPAAAARPMRALSSTPSLPEAALPRTYCGALSRSDVGRTVSLKGHVHSLRAVGGVIFMVVRDWRGQVQAKWTEDGSAAAAAFDVAGRVSLESVVELTGTVRERPDTMVNDRMRTGSLEVEVASFAVLNAAKDIPTARAAPLSAEDGVSSSHGGMPHAEEFLLRHRHMHLRDPSMQRNLRLRSDVTAAVRHCLRQLDFVEVETPLLFKSTPEGAREFLVPTRRPGAFYALPQSPQQYKQLLMAGGVERYFQIARCFRDEGGRRDRQPEFTQIDLEMAFPNGADDVIEVAEALVAAAWRAAEETASAAAGAGVEGATLAAPRVEGGGPPFQRMRFADALATYGSDKPDLRLEPHMRIAEVTVLLAAQRDATRAALRERAATASEAAQAEAPLHVHALRAPVIGGALSNKALTALLGELADVMEAEAMRSSARGAPAPQLHSARLGSGGASAPWRWQSFHSDAVPNVHRIKLDAPDAATLGAELRCEEGDLVLLCSCVGASALPPRPRPFQGALPPRARHSRACIPRCSHAPSSPSLPAVTHLRRAAAGSATARAASSARPARYSARNSTQCPTQESRSPTTTFASSGWRAFRSSNPLSRETTLRARRSTSASLRCSPRTTPLRRRTRRMRR